MKPLIVLLHGFNSKNGRNTTDKMIAPFNEAGFDVTEADYRGGYAGLVPGLFATKTHHARAEAERITRNILNHRRPVVLVGHSNGCAMAAMISENLYKRGMGDLIVGVALFNAALRSDYGWGYLAAKVVNCYCPSDHVLIYGATLRAKYSELKCWAKKLFNDGCTGHLWGKYGSCPHDGVINCEYVDLGCGHSTVFENQARINFYVDKVISLLELKS